MKSKGKVTSLRDLLASNRSISWLDNIHISVPALVAFRKEHNIVKRSIKRMEMADVA